jgi:hypothetical protein
VQKYLPLLRSRLPVLAAIATVLVALLIGIHTRGSLAGAWGILQDFPLSPRFADTRTITHSIDCVLSGQNPYFVRAFDPWHRLYNYPPIWLEARYLGISSSSSNWIGTVMSVATAIAFLFLFDAKKWISMILTYLAVLSRSVLFAVERGNTDQIIFFLLVFGLVVIDRHPARLRSYLRGFLIALLTVLKIYPLAVVTIFLRNRRGVPEAILAAAFSLTALVITAGHSLPILLANTPRDSLMSYGAYPFFLSISQHLLYPAVPIIQDHPEVATLGALILGAFAMLAGAACGKRLDRFLPPLDFNRARGSIAIAALTIFFFTFVSGASFDYRLLFLMGALAYLIEDINRGSTLRAIPPAILILFLLWKPSHLSFHGEIFDGSVFFLASLWLGNSFFYHLGFRRLPSAYAISEEKASEAIAKNHRYPRFNPTT